MVSFHFGLPEPGLVDRVKAAGCKVISSATTVDEACWLEKLGADAIIAQGYEAGGHRGTFLDSDHKRAVASQAGTFALVPQIVDAVSVPVIAAGSIGDGRGIAAAFMLGAAGVQVGTAFLLCAETATPPLYRAALRHARANQTVVTNVFSGRSARALVNRLVGEKTRRRIFRCPWASCRRCERRLNRMGAPTSRRSGLARPPRLPGRCRPNC